MRERRGGREVERPRERRRDDGGWRHRWRQPREAATPSMTLIMRANLLRGFKRLRLSLWHIKGIIVVRFIILPLLET